MIHRVSLGDSLAIGGELYSIDGFDFTANHIKLSKKEVGIASAFEFDASIGLCLKCDTQCFGGYRINDSDYCVTCFDIIKKDK